MALEAEEVSLGLYFHVPFCKSRCPYCDFYSTTSLSRREDYTAALVRALDTAPAPAGTPAATVYFGGGTPYLLGRGLLALLKAADRRYPLTADCEITLEANPGDLSLSLLRELRAGGFNRLSLGLQAGDPAGLRLLGRRHTAEESARGVAMARQAGFANLSVDLMLATPGQTPQQAAALAEYGAGLEPEHISAYLLKVEPGTPFARDGMAERCPGEDETAELYLTACRTLRERGYRHYEISNFARPGYESRHNLGYWQGRDYLGLGPSAASCHGGRRYRMPPDLGWFLASEDPWREVEDQGPAGGLLEQVMLSLRLARGLDTRGLGEEGAAILRRAAPLKEAGLLTVRDGVVALTEAGFLVSNGVILSLLPE